MEGIPTKHHDCLQMDQNLRTCYYDYLKSTSGCYNPSANLTIKPQCETTNQESEVIKTNGESLNMGENDFAKKTGCKPSCSFNQYKLAFSYDREKIHEGIIPSTAKSM